MKLDKLGKVTLFIVGLIPYIALSFLVVIMWDKYIGYTPLQGDLLDYARDTLFAPNNILSSLALLGSWASWYLCCKLFKYMAWSH